MKTIRRPIPGRYPGFGHKAQSAEKPLRNKENPNSSLRNESGAENLSRDWKVLSLEKYVIHGGKPLYGEVEVSGAKNAAVAIIPAALMVDGVCRLENIPQISDADMLLTILEHLGAKVRMINRSTVEIDCTSVRYTDAPYDLMRKIRASYYLIGAMLGRFGAAKTTMPGGCNFGVRPIDQHIKGMTALGADVEVSGGFVYAKAADGKLHGTKIYLDKVSVGATMNIILAASMARGRTIIEPAAKEPHIVDLANFLNSMGADVRGAGTDSVKINGTDSLHGGTYTIIPDQIEAGTYMVACAAAGGEVRITNVIPRHLESISAKLREMGVTVVAYEDSVVVKSSGNLRRVNIKTMPELRKMGANVYVDGRVACIEGVDRLCGAPVAACDLRAGAAMVIAGLMADGTTEVEDIHYIERGYENFVGKLNALGADIALVDVPDEGEKLHKPQIVS